MMNSYVGRAVSIFMGLALAVSCTITYAAGTEDSDYDYEKIEEYQANNPWMKRARLASMIGIGVGTLVIGNVVVTPFLVSALAGYASEEFVLENEKFKKYAANKLKFITEGQNRNFGQFARGFFGDGTALFLLGKLGKTIWCSLSGIPMSAGFVVGQALGIAAHNRDCCDCIRYGWQSGWNYIRDRQNDSRIPSQQSQSAAISRVSGAALSWVILAGLASKFPKIF